MGIESIVVMLIVGAVAGWLAGKLVRGGGFGILGNIVIGILGAVVAGFILPRLGFGVGGGVLWAIIHSTIGAVILLVVVRLIKQA
ncbi:MAG: GlsB/YeaQ/YmgE family stress response membrane protein [Paracoccaceae bacterium]